MSQETTRQRLMTAIAAGLFIAVVFLAVAVFQMNSKIDRMNEIAAAQPVSGDAAIPSQPETPAENDEAVQSGEDSEWKTYAPPAPSGTWDPFAEMERMQAEIDRIFGNAFNRFGHRPPFGTLQGESTISPRVDMEDLGSQYTVTVEIPGADESAIDVELDGQALNVQATTEQQRTSTSGASNLVYQERHLGSFQRRIQFPDAIDGGTLDTNYENGVLTITVDKAT